jgi:hypothetical protein
MTHLLYAFKQWGIGKYSLYFIKLSSIWMYLDIKICLNTSDVFYRIEGVNNIWDLCFKGNMFEMNCNYMSLKKNTAYPCRVFGRHIQK